MHLFIVNVFDFWSTGRRVVVSLLLPEFGKCEDYPCIEKHSVFERIRDLLDHKDALVDEYVTLVIDDDTVSEGGKDGYDAMCFEMYPDFTSNIIYSSKQSLLPKRALYSAHYIVDLARLPRPRSAARILFMGAPLYLLSEATGPARQLDSLFRTVPRTVTMLFLDIDTRSLRFQDSYNKVEILFSKSRKIKNKLS